MNYIQWTISKYGNGRISRPLPFKVPNQLGNTSLINQLFDLNANKPPPPNTSITNDHPPLTRSRFPAEIEIVW